MGILSFETVTRERIQHDLTHWHDRLEAIRVLEGSMYCVINGTNCLIETGDILLINRQQLRHMIPLKGQSLIFQQFLIDQNIFAADQEIYRKYVQPALSEQSFKYVLLKDDNKISAELRNAFDEISELERVKPAAYEMREMALMYLLFQRLYQYYAALREEPNAMLYQDMLLYRQITDYIYRNYMEKLSLDMIAASGSISRSKCCSIFREYAGHSPIDFLNLYRLRVSTGLLRNTTKNIASIAADCGFGQQSYYNRLFLREYGMTPGEFRRVQV